MAFRRASSFRVGRRRHSPLNRSVSFIATEFETSQLDEIEEELQYETEELRVLTKKDMTRVTGPEFYSLNEKACQVLGLTDEGVSFLLKSKKKRWRPRV
mmetsp:Transcript_20795/g.25221  ORF Transcript_20795/g.25221 Transcript_20795/m.25221 type:complete len:99 (-) Transcript_20795:117-413(-)|eukprot:CAMPEP_0204824464 /NCGR_PEP_ID=MMETSP1346-20131115/2485_1 /ASSEMBLY_ACC=CAM_ASM_000771 /TAXON_ID=215587 /ORGANISM="Aplanochytrium stocchinoi, Strain GSBS06" /LENGTH=98 /DNA_ID=CAMNT_0051951633 /DNA_START=395 /DNA_END=691 /DNA_ORIENTATION=-